MNEEEKALVLKQANLYLEGYSLREVAALTGQSHVTVRRNFQEKLKEVGHIYVQVMAKMQDNLPESIKNKDVMKRVLEAYDLCVNHNMTVLEIAEKLGTTEMVIYRDLTKRLKQYHEIDSYTVNREMIEKVALSLKNHSISNSPFLANKNDFDPKLLEKIYPTFEKRYAFLSKCVLVFGLNLDALSELLQIDGKTLYNNFLKCNLRNINSVTFVLYHGFQTKEKSQERFREFFASLSTAIMKKDMNKAQELINTLGDTKAINVKAKHAKKENLTNEDILVILKYQLKYCCSTETVCSSFKMSKNNYIKRVMELEDQYPEYINNFYYLEDYYNNQKRSGGRYV